MENKTVITTAPPPPSEVKIRTMRSDIDSMMRSGGGAPSFQDVSVQGLSLDAKLKAAPAVVRTPMPAASVPMQAPASAPTTTTVTAVAPITEAAPAGKPPSLQMPSGKENSPVSAGPKKNLAPIVIVIVVAIVAVAVVGYFAYTIFK
jgi:hypothetical protein